jgi:hypothetical protein
MVERRERRRRREHPAGEQLLLRLARLVVGDGEIGDGLRRSFGTLTRQSPTLISSVPKRVALPTGA